MQQETFYTSFKNSSVTLIEFRLGHFDSDRRILRKLLNNQKGIYCICASPGTTIINNLKLFLPGVENNMKILGKDKRTREDVEVVYNNVSINSRRFNTDDLNQDSTCRNHKLSKFSILSDLIKEIMPPIYIGETDNLYERLSRHFNSINKLSRLTLDEWTVALGLDESFSWTESSLTFTYINESDVRMEKIYSINELEHLVLEKNKDFNSLKSYFDLSYYENDISDDFWKEIESYCDFIDVDIEKTKKTLKSIKDFGDNYYDYLKGISDFQETQIDLLIPESADNFLIKIFRFNDQTIEMNEVEFFEEWLINLFSPITNRKIKR